MAAVRIISTVSGKGGSVRPVLSANLARIVAFSRKVLLIDFDFPNQGLNGSICRRGSPICFSAHDMIWSRNSRRLTKSLRSDKTCSLCLPSIQPPATDLTCGSISSVSLSWEHALPRSCVY